jgi:hypothetical protein
MPELTPELTPNSAGNQNLRPSFLGFDKTKFPRISRTLGMRRAPDRLAVMVGASRRYAAAVGATWRSGRGSSARSRATGGGRGARVGTLRPGPAAGGGHLEGVAEAPSELGQRRLAPGEGHGGLL